MREVTERDAEDPDAAASADEFETWVATAMKREPNPKRIENAWATWKQKRGITTKESLSTGTAEQRRQASVKIARQMAEREKRNEPEGGGR